MALRQIDKFLKWDEKRKQYSPVLWRREVLPSWLTVTEDTPLPIAIPAAGTPGPLVTFKQPYSSLEGADRNLGTPFEVRSLVFQDSTDGTLAADFTVMLQEVGEARQFMNRPVHVRTIFGTGQQPALLREPYMFLSQHNISCQLNKVTGGATTTRLYLCGAQYYPWGPELLQYKQDKTAITNLLNKWLNRRQYVSPFWMTTDTPVTLAAGATADFFTKVGDDGHFEAFGHTQVHTGAFAYSISETKTNQTLANGTVSAVAGAGDARFPTIYPTPYLLPAGYRLKLTLTNLTAAPNTIFWTWFGRKIFAPFTKVAEVLGDTAVPTPADVPTLMPTKPLE